MLGQGRKTSGDVASRAAARVWSRTRANYLATAFEWSKGGPGGDKTALERRAALAM
jgi:hypothetical protein